MTANIKKPTGRVLFALLCVCLAVTLTGAFSLFAMNEGNGSPANDNGSVGQNGGLADDGTGAGNGDTFGGTDGENAGDNGAEGNENGGVIGEMGRDIRDGANEAVNDMRDVAEGRTADNGRVRDTDGLISNDRPGETEEGKSTFERVAVIVGIIAAVAVLAAVILTVPARRAKAANKNTGKN